jgi:hypothetical protein
MKKITVNLCAILVLIVNMLCIPQLFGIFTLPLWVYAIPYVILLLSLLFFYIKTD